MDDDTDDVPLMVVAAPVASSVHVLFVSPGIESGDFESLCSCGSLLEDVVVVVASR